MGKLMQIAIGLMIIPFVIGLFMLIFGIVAQNIGIIVFLAGLVICGGLAWGILTPKPSLENKYPQGEERAPAGAGGLLEKLNLDDIFKPEREEVPDKNEFLMYMKKRVIGQDVAIQKVCNRIRAKIGSAKSGKPLAILLPGPTGVGKTELVKTVAGFIGGNFKRFDCGEFSQEHTVSNLFGSPKGYLGSEDGGKLPNELRKKNDKNRYVFLFDEVEKAHKKIWEKLLAFLDEGRCSDVLGEEKAPKDTFLFFTSNLLKDKFADDPDPKTAKDKLRLDGFFPEEFVGRIDLVCPMAKLSQETVVRLAFSMATELALEYDITLTIDETAISYLVRRVWAESQKAGGRGIRDRLKDELLEEFLDYQAEGVRSLSISENEGSLTYNTEGEI